MSVSELINDFARVNESKGICWIRLTYCVPEKGLKSVVRMANSIEQLHSSLARQFKSGFYINHRTGKDTND